MKLEITEDCCATARQLIADGVDPNERLEFYRGDMLCLQETAPAFASRTVREDDRRGPEYIPYRPIDPEAQARLTRARARSDFKVAPLG